MKGRMLLILICISSFSYAQKFTRSELTTSIYLPWEITVGPNDFLWVSHYGGKVSRVNPSNGEKMEVFTAADYFDGSPLENSTFCPEVRIGAGTFGLALHPDFSNPDSAFIYFVYSYNHGTSAAPSTKYRIKRLKWDESTLSITAESNIVDSISNGFDHWGGRLIAVKQNGKSYLYLSVGDNGISDENTMMCYSSAAANPNNLAQDVHTQNGKIHRFNMNGSIPFDNPIAGNSFYTRGHRNPQGLAFNPITETVYAIEHGDRTDDEINLLLKGMNYGWKNVRGFHSDNSFTGEQSYFDNYQPNPLVANDTLIDPIFSWCTFPQTSNVYTDWCTVAPSDGIYYKYNFIPEWNNSLLIVTLKDGVTTDREVYQVKLTADGNFAPSTFHSPNPLRFFGEDQALNGRLRDIAISNDGRKVYLINNSGTNADKITVYTYQEPSPDVFLYPNPTNKSIQINGITDWQAIEEISILTSDGKSVSVKLDEFHNIDVSEFSSGLFFVQIRFKNSVKTIRFVHQ